MVPLRSGLGGRCCYCYCCCNSSNTYPPIERSSCAEESWRKALFWHSTEGASPHAQPSSAFSSAGEGRSREKRKRKKGKAKGGGGDSDEGRKEDFFFPSSLFIFPLCLLHSVRAERGGRRGSLGREQPPPPFFSWMSGHMKIFFI